MTDKACLIVSVDVEDWPQSTWNHSLDITERARRNIEHLLDILAQHGKNITMFVLGKFAERFPETVKRIFNDGHEVASHGYGHIEIFRQSPTLFRNDVYRAKCLTEDLIGQPVIGYRAPDFSIVPATTWAFEILAEQGYKYDSSIFPIKASRYGIKEWPPHPVRVWLPSGHSIVELPIGTMTLFGRRWPVAGGGYHRLLPWVFIRWSINHQLITNKKAEPFMTYCHPYEFDDKEFADLDLGIPLFTRLHQGLGRRGFHKKFEHLLTNFEVVQASSLLTYSHWPDFAL